MDIGFVLKKYGFDIRECRVEPFGSGLINHTWVLDTEGGKFIVQRINNNVFKKPKHIAENIRLMGEYLKKQYPDYLFTQPMPNTEAVSPEVSGQGRELGGGQMVHIKGKGYFRIFPFVKNSHSKDVLQNPNEAFEAASQFGQFTRLLADFDATQLHDTIPNFHNLVLRYNQFLKAIKNGNKARIAESQSAIDFLLKQKDIVEVFKKIKNNPNFKRRVTHHDTKISNVLFDKNNKGLCVIDLDTTMSGYFISDVGDMMRTYLSPVSEEEADFSKIEIREEFYKAIVKGYYNQMKDELTEAESQYFFYAGKFMIYMQALRFLADYLNDDIYYGAKYPTHNKVRAENQIVLLKKLMEKEAFLDIKPKDMV